jgi:hypothetical protein
MNPIILTNGVDAIVTSKIGSADSEMIHLDVLPELEDEVELRTVDQDEIMEAGIDWRHYADQAGTLRAWSYQQFSNTMYP